MKIAVAVDTDKETIVKKTGQAAFFAIYEDDKLINFISNRHGEGNHGEGNPQGGAFHKPNHSHQGMENGAHTNEHKKDASKLVGCDVILVQAIGENMREALESIGLKIKKIRKKDGITADEVIKNFLADNI